MADRATSVDLIRHRYAILDQSDGSGVSVQSLSRVANVSQMISPPDDDTSRLEKIDQIIGYLGEFDEILDPGIKEPDPDDIFAIPVKRKYRYRARKPGHLPIGEGLSLLFDSRSTIQLSRQFGDLTGLEILSSGHRLIQSEKADSWGLNTLTEFPDLSFYPNEPNKLILSCFDDPKLFDDRQWGKSDSLFLDLSSDSIDINVYSDTLKRGLHRRPEGWRSEPESALKIGDWLFLLEMLIVPAPAIIDPNDKPYRRVFRLHRKSDPGGVSDAAVVLFHPGIRDYVPPPFQQYASKQHSRNRNYLRGNLLRDVLRAFIAAAGKTNSVRAADQHLLNFQWRTTLGPDGLVKSLEEINPDLAKNLELIIRNGLWIS